MMTFLCGFICANHNSALHLPMNQKKSTKCLSAVIFQFLATFKATNHEEQQFLTVAHSLEHFCGCESAELTLKTSCIARKFMQNAFKDLQATKKSTLRFHPFDTRTQYVSNEFSVNKIGPADQFFVVFHDFDINTLIKMFLFLNLSFKFVNKMFKIRSFNERLSN